MTTGVLKKRYHSSHARKTHKEVALARSVSVSLAVSSSICSKLKHPGLSTLELVACHPAALYYGSMYPEQFVEFLKVEKAAAILRTLKQDAAAHCMAAAVKGGFRVVEFTLTIPGAFELIQEFSRREDLAVGAGTVLNLADARRAVEAGACFLASPVLDPRIVAEARAMNVAIIPGTHTATEMWQAYQLGASLQKLFPAAAGGPAYVKSCLAPMPFLRIVPTNGVDASNAAEYFRAGAYAVGFNYALFPEEFINGARYDLIEERAAKLLDSCRP